MSNTHHAITVTASGRVAWYTIGGKLVEIAGKGALLSDRMVAAPSPDDDSLLMSGLGMTNEGDLYLATYRVLKTGGEERDEKFRLNRSVDKWSLLSFGAKDAGGSGSGALVGIDGDSVVISNGGALRMYEWKRSTQRGVGGAER